jgi:hypothetical protein
MKIWGFRKRDTVIKWCENVTKLEPSLHFESCFSRIQLLVVEEPSPLVCLAPNILAETPVQSQFVLGHKFLIFA